MLDGKRILLIIGGGIAAYKSLDLIRQLSKAGARVTPVLTRGGAQFVTPLSVSALAGSKVYTDLFDLTDEAEMGHIEFSRAADLVVVAPATADLMAKMAHGHADELASTLLMATDKRVLIAPAMNVRMWEHAATQRNLATLRSDGILIAGPNEGNMACGEYGPGRMSEPHEILGAIEAALTDGPLKGRHILITSGPTHEPIDPVRYIANRSSGQQGAAIAEALAGQGAQITFITGPATAPRPKGVNVIEVETAAQMLAATEAALPADAAIFAAAVADYRVEEASAQKIKKSGAEAPEIRLTQNPDILKTISNHAQRPKLVIGFAAETNDVQAHAKTKLDKKGCDWILANDVSPSTGIMGGAENQITRITRDGTDPWPRMTKRQTAQRIATLVAEALA
ncbi:bifunctional phosphopantothenoylcysteine decarboxylase/phosphopantothenate--cysteine ligase CoaBC [Aestuariibius sp. 2305UL40-4]|uniref:bifunctional phosphopantothenoylcysteine decarboxylase/phosphopantothenate--cysteine ligase CoaBC n=1 Tax=Aestuariibius violaceus TaxID=3234132 RepID=UPI00345EB1C1